MAWHGFSLTKNADGDGCLALKEEEGGDMRTKTI
jgi:hypothetical protein